MTRLRSVLLLFALPASLFAEEAILPKIAVVDLTEVFAKHPETTKATRTLTEAREASREEFKEKSNALKEILQRHQELIREGKKTEAAEVLKQAGEAEKVIATLRTTGQRDLEVSFRRAKQEILKEIKKAIAEFNTDGTYALILDVSSSSSNGLPQVVHAPGAEDITDEVVAFIAEREAGTEGKP